MENTNQKMYPPVDNSFNTSQQQLQHFMDPPPIDNSFGTSQQQPQQFMDPPPSYQMGQNQSMPFLIQQPTTIIIQNAVVGPDPTNMTCPSCQSRITSTVIHEPHSRTHSTALALCLVGCWLCCLFPYCIDSCQSANHTCPRCNAFLGSYRN